MIRPINMNLKKLFLPAFLLIATAGFSQTIAELKLDKQHSILNDKVFLQFPADAQNIARQTDIMAADPNINKETRIMMDIGEQRLVFFSRELYVTSNDKLIETVSAQNKEQGKVQLLTQKDSLLSVLVTPTKFDSTQNAILINELYVQAPDKTVFVIGAYINPEAYPNKDEFQKLSKRVFSSLSKGNRKLNYKARTEVSPIFEGKKKFSIQLPEGYVVTKDQKYDFEVLKFQKIQDIADTNWTSLTIYTGNHPSYFYGEYDFNEDNAVISKETFLNKPVAWLNFSNDAQKLYLKEQQIPADQIENGLIVHIAMSGNSPQAIKELTKIVENIKLID